MTIGIRTLDQACLAAFTALAVGGCFVTVSSAKAKAARLRGVRQTAQLRLDELTQAEAALARLNRVLHDNQAALETLLSRLPETGQIGEFLAEVDALANQASVSINTVSQGAAVREEIGARTPIALSCQGSFAGLHALLDGLERLTHIVRVERVSISRTDLSDSCRMTVACHVYGR